MNDVCATCFCPHALLFLSMKQILRKKLLFLHMACPQHNCPAHSLEVKACQLEFPKSFLTRLSSS